MTQENRETFFARINPYFSPSQLLSVQLAYTLAKFGHRAQKRQEIDLDGNQIRYFEHCRRVAISIIDEGKILDPTVIIVALLHDSLEDTKDVTAEMIEHCFGSEAASITKQLSKNPKEGYIDRLNKTTDWRVLFVKMCDRLDNLRSLESANLEFIQKQYSETKNKYLSLFTKLFRMVPKEYEFTSAEVYSKIEQQLYDLKLKHGLKL